MSKFKVKMVQKFTRTIEFTEETPNLLSIDQMWDKIDHEYDIGNFDKLFANATLTLEDYVLEVEDDIG